MGSSIRRTFQAARPVPVQCRASAAARPKGQGRSFLSLSFTSSQMAASRRDFSTISSSFTLLRTPGARPEGDIIINAHGEGIWLLKHHAYALSEQVDIHISIDILPIQQDFPWILQPSTRSFMRFRVFISVDLPQPEGPMNAVISRSRISRLIFFSAWKLPVIQVQIFYFKFCGLFPSYFPPCFPLVIFLAIKPRAR